ncbi:MAG: GNAT family N-acetyltransferase [Chloroflexi bacterium]|nr:GNAT family N-acetyltransferase [Chloroflexota bacterium]
MIMTSGNSNNVTVRKATIEDLEAIKRLSDQHRAELGFVLKPALEKAILDGEVFVAVAPQIVGFVHYHHRRDSQTTLYHIVVNMEERRQGIGRALLSRLKVEATERGQSSILLKCPTELPANKFYEQCGYSHIDVEPGKHRRLNVWQISLD